jgi:chorismate mutase
MSGERMLRAVRGAITVAEDTSEEIREATRELLETLLDRNALGPDDLVSIIFTTTHDLVSDFPAAAARDLGLANVPLLCAQEIPVLGSMPKCIRALVHCHAPGDRPIRHVYLREARQLRLDLPE